jgi:Holliday junction DNA helicase RuvA
VQSVSGVGPKIALALLAVLDPDDLRRALSTGDTAALTRAPGIGKKGAERLVLELKDKVGAMPRPGAGLPAGAAAGWRDQLVDALGGLGFPAKQALDVVETVAADSDDPAVVTGDVQVLLRRALSLLARSR